MSERLPYEPLHERQRAIDMVHALKVTKDGDTFDLIARLLRDRDRLDWLSAMRWAEIENHGGGSRIDGPDPAYGADTTLRAAIDAAMRAERETTTHTLGRNDHNSNDIDPYESAANA